MVNINYDDTGDLDGTPDHLTPLPGGWGDTFQVEKRKNQKTSQKKETVWVVVNNRTGEEVNGWEYPSSSQAESYARLLNSLHASWRKERS